MCNTRTPYSDATIAAGIAFISRRCRVGRDGYLPLDGKALDNLLRAMAVWDYVDQTIADFKTPGANPVTVAATFDESLDRLGIRFGFTPPHSRAARAAAIEMLLSRAV